MSHIKRIAVVANGNAGQHMKRRKLVEAAIASFTKDSDGVIVYLTKSLEDLERATDEIASDDQGFDLVVSIGGDGSTNYLMSSLLPKLERLRRTFPAFHIVPAGTMNIVPTSLEQRTGRAAIHDVRAMVGAIRAGAPISAFRLNTLVVNGQHGFIFGAGLPANAIERYNEADVRGPKRALAMTAEIIIEEVRRLIRLPPKRASVVQPFLAELSVIENGGAAEVETRAWTSVLAATVDHVAKGCRITSRAYEQVGRFHLIASDAGALEYAVNGPALLAGISTEEIGGRLASEIVIRYQEPAVRQLDGEVLGTALSGDVDTVRIGPLLTFLVA